MAARGTAGSRPAPRLPHLCHRHLDRPDRLGGADLLRFLARRDLHPQLHPRRSSSWRAPSSPSAGMEARPGMPITSPSATACSPSSRWARGSWARSRRCRRWSRNRAGPWMRRWSASPASGSPSACGGSITCCLQRQVLHAHRDRSFVWGYGQMVIVTAIVATGAGLHVAAYFIEHKAHIGALATVLTVAIPVGSFSDRSMRSTPIWFGRFDPFHVWLIGGTPVSSCLAVAAFAGRHQSALRLIILMLAPPSRLSDMKCWDTVMRPRRWSVILRRVARCTETKARPPRQPRNVHSSGINQAIFGARLPEL